MMRSTPGGAVGVRHVRLKTGYAPGPKRHTLGNRPHLAGDSETACINQRRTELRCYS